MTLAVPAGIEVLPDGLQRWRQWLVDALDPTWRHGEWDRDAWWFDGNPDNPATAVRRCSVARCGKLVQHDTMCAICGRAWRKTGLPAEGPAFEKFLATHEPERAKLMPGETAPRCLVGADAVQCGRPAHTRGLCHGHYSHWEKAAARPSAPADLTLEAWARHAKPFPAPDAWCAVNRCEGPTFGRGALCRYHYWRHRRVAPEEPQVQWATREAPFLGAGQFSLLPLPEVVRYEVLYVLQRRDERGGVIYPSVIRQLVPYLAQHDQLVGLPADQLAPRSSYRNTLWRAQLNEIEHWLHDAHLQMTGDDPRERLVWDFKQLNLRCRDGRNSVRVMPGKADFSTISQEWLRTLAMQRCAAFTNSTHILATLTAVVVASRALETTADGGHDVAALGLPHLDAITTGFRHWCHDDGRSRSRSRRYIGLETVWSLLEFGRRSGLLDDAPGNFLPDPQLHRLKLNPAPEDDEASGKALPEPIIAQLDAQLHLLDGPGYSGWTNDQVKLMMRTAYVVLRDTGRRPREVCGLTVDCVEVGDDGAILIWDNFKSERRRRRLPIAQATATAIREWQEIRAQLRSGDRRDSYLFPARLPDAADPYLAPKQLRDSLHDWLEAMPDLLSDTVDAAGQRQPFPKSRIYPYAFRHSYAQRHADAGVPIDVLRDLMDHKSITTTQGYYRVTQRRKREAVRTLSLQTVDRTGAAASPQSTASYELRSVAAPFGNCTEPSNVKAGGGACPIRFQCAGCGFYRADPSYIPAIEDHMQALRADRERARAMDVDDFVLRNLDDQIDAYGHVLSSMRSNLATANDAQRAEIEQAATVLRKLRAGRTALPVTTNGPTARKAP